MKADPSSSANGARARGVAVARALALGLLAGQLCLFDLVQRGPGAYLRDPRLFASAAASAGLGYLAARAAARSVVARVLVAFAYGALLVSEIVFVRFYRVPIDAQIVVTALHAWGDVRPVLLGMLPSLAPAALALAVVEGSLFTWAAPAAQRGVLAESIAAGVLLAGVLVGPPLRDATPELRLVDAIRALDAPKHAAASAARTVPSLHSRRASLPDVLFLLTESVRASDYCSAKDPRCPFTPELDRVLPDRIALEHLDAVASYTVVSLSAILTGQTQLGARSDLLEAPTLFDYVRAARARREDGTAESPHEAYWSSQSIGVFEDRPLGAIDDRFTLEDLAGGPVEDEDLLVSRGLDRDLAARVAARMPTLAEPRFVFAHLSGTHAPYFVDPAHAPFAPYQHEVTWSGLDRLHAAYRDAVVAQDAEVAAIVRAFLEARHGRPWVVVFTSDHGEAFGEHRAIHHGQSLYAEQVHVPGWIAHGDGALTDDEARALRERAGEPTTHLDLVPTLLDLYGVASDPALSPLRRGMLGRSWLREVRGARPPIPVTNCTALFPCPLDTWGMLGQEHALLAQRWDGSFRCVARDGDRETPVADAPECQALLTASRLVFPALPNGLPNR